MRPGGALELLESLEGHGIPASLPLFVVPKAGQQDALDDWLENELAGRDVVVLTLRQQIAHLHQSTQQQMLSMAVLESVIAIVAAAGLAVLNYISTAERMSEFGVLHALGCSRLRLVGRAFGEIGFTTGVAWGLTAIVAVAAMMVLRHGVFGPIGLTFDLLNTGPWLYTLPIPIAALGATAGTTARTLSRLDPVSIIERRS